MEKHLIPEKNKIKTKKKKNKIIICVKTGKFKLLHCAIPLEIGGWRACWV